MRQVVAAVLLVVSLAWSACATAGSISLMPAPIEMPAYRQMALDMGCRLLRGFVQIPAPGVNAGWATSGPLKQYIGVTPGLLRLPDDQRRSAIAHEIAHCLQEQDGLMASYPEHARALELDADIRAVHYLCSPAGGRVQAFAAVYASVRAQAGDDSDPADDETHPPPALRAAVAALVCEAVVAATPQTQ